MVGNEKDSDNRELIFQLQSAKQKSHELDRPGKRQQDSYHKYIARLKKHTSPFRSTNRKNK